MQHYLEVTNAPTKERIEYFEKFINDKKNHLVLRKREYDLIIKDDEQGIIDWERQLKQMKTEFKDDYTEEYQEACKWCTIQVTTGRTSHIISIPKHKSFPMEFELRGDRFIVQAIEVLHLFKRHRPNEEIIKQLS